MGLLLMNHPKKKILYPRDIPGNVLSLQANKANKGQAPVTSTTKVWSDMSKIRNVLSYANFVSNGGFRNTIGWTPTNSTVAANNNIGTITGSGTTPYPSIAYITSTPVVVGNLYYCVAKLRSKNSDCLSFTMNFKGSTSGANQAFSKGSPSNDVQYTLSSIITAAADQIGNVTIQLVTTYTDATTASGKNVEMQEVMIINLTSLGLAHLSLAQCSELFPFTTLGSSSTKTRYNPQDWAQWTTQTNAICNSTGAELSPQDALYARIRMDTSFKTNTKYGILLNVLSSTLTSLATIDPNHSITANEVTISNTIGNQKYTVTTLGTITTNQCYIYANQQTTGNNIKLKDIRVFELPTGSQIETDFTNLTADQLNVLYPMGYGEATTIMANDCTLNNLAGTSASGFNKVPVVNGKGSNIVYNNLLSNGNFVNTNGYTTIGGAFAWSVSNNEATVTNLGTTTAYKLYISTGVMQVITGRRYYVRELLKSNFSGCSLTSVGNSGTTSKSHTGSGNYELLSFITTATGTGEPDIRALHTVSSGDISANPVKIKEFMIVDLTANTYIQALESSLGRVLTTEECDRLFAFTASSSNVVVDTQYALTLDGTDDYGAFLNGQSLDVTTNEFLLAFTFRIAVGATGQLFYHGLDTAANSKYYLSYDGTNKKINGSLNGQFISMDIGNNSVLENTWYNFIFYRQSSGVIKPYLNKIEKSNGNYVGTLNTYPNIRLGCRSSNLGGTTHTAFLKYDLASLSIYQAPTLDINKILKAETNIAKNYTGVV